MNFQSGYQTFERHAGGFRPGEMTVLAVPPAMGATAFCLGMMNAIEGQGSILYLSLSATAERMQLRLENTGIPSVQGGRNLLRIDHHGRHHFILHHELPKTVELLETIAHRAVLHTPDLIIVNNLSFIGRERRHIFDPTGAHHRTLRHLKTMAVALQRPILLIATIVNDSVERRGPLLGRFAIHEPYADNIMVMERYDYYDQQTDDFDEPVKAGDTDLHLLKCRRALTGRFRLRLSDKTWLMEETGGLIHLG